MKYWYHRILRKTYIISIISCTHTICAYIYKYYKIYTLYDEHVKSVWLWTSVLTYQVWTWFYRLGQLQFLPDRSVPSLYGRGPALQVMLVANLAKVIVAAYSCHLSSQRYRFTINIDDCLCIGWLKKRILRLRFFSSPINSGFPNPSQYQTVNKLLEFSHLQR